MANYALSLVPIFFIFSIFSVSGAVPFILLHGLGDSCSNAATFNYATLLSHLSGSSGFCLEVGTGSATSWGTPLLQQVEEVCEKVKAIPFLQNGYNIVAQSQGTLVGRGLVELCDNAPPVFNFISMGGPQAGVASLPCNPIDYFCNQYTKISAARMYTDYVQAISAPSGYTKYPNEISAYLAKCSFLPKLNNELPSKNSIYKERLTRLKNLVLIMFQDDTVVIPKESSWFEFFPDNYQGSTKPLKETEIYTEDWIGLRTLDETGRLNLVSVPGQHLLISFSDTLRYVVPYLKS